MSATRHGAPRGRRDPVSEDEGVRCLSYQDSFPDPSFRVWIEFSLFPEREVPRHSHEFGELVVVRHGTGLHVTGRQRYPIAAGDVFYVRPRCAHEYWEVKGLDLCNIFFDPALFLEPVTAFQRIPGYFALFHIEPLLRGHSALRSKLHLQKDQMRFVNDLVGPIQEELEGRAPGYEAMTQSYLNLLIAYLSRCYATQDTQDGREVMSLSRVLSYIESSYAEPVRLGDLARIAGMSRSSLARAFAQHFDASPVGYVVQQRLRRACDLLRNPDLSIADVAKAVGFSDTGYFGRRFRRAYGCTPREYRKRLQ